MADVLYDGKYDFCYLAARAVVILVLFKVVIGYPDCEMDPQHPKELRATTREQYLMSPNYDIQYPNKLNCHWRINATDSSHHIVLEGLDSYIEDHGDCDYDFLRIYDGSTTWSPILGTYCGGDLPEEISIGPHMFIRFFTDGSVSYKGFKLMYYSSPKDLSKSDKEEDSDNENSSNGKSTHVTVIVGGVVGGVMCSVLLLAFVCACATTKKCRCCRKPRRTVHPNSDTEESRPGRRSHPRIDDIHRSSTPSPVESYPMQEFPIYTITRPSAPPPSYLDSYCHPPDEPYPSHDIPLYRLPSSPPPPYSFTDPHPNIYAVPNYIPHSPLRRY